MKQIQHQVQLCTPGFIKKAAPLRILLLHQPERRHRLQDWRGLPELFQDVLHAMG